VKEGHAYGGGYGSGRWGWHSKAATVEESKRLPIRDVLAGGPGMCSIYWTRRGQPSGNICYTVDADMDQVRLVYTSTPRGGEPVQYD
jgi:hypothetical protein